MFSKFTTSLDIKHGSELLYDAYVVDCTGHLGPICPACQLAYIKLM